MSLNVTKVLSILLLSRHARTENRQVLAKKMKCSKAQELEVTFFAAAQIVSG